MKIKIAMVVFTSLILAVNAHAENKPAFDFENIMDTYFDDSSGLISFSDYTVAFAQGDTFDGFVAVLDAQGKVVGQYAFFPEYRNREGVFARVLAQAGLLDRYDVQGPAGP